MDRTIDAQPFLGQLAADPSARGLFAALSLLAMGVERGEADLGPMQAGAGGVPPDAGRRRRPAIPRRCRGRTCSAATSPTRPARTVSSWPSPGWTTARWSRAAPPPRAIRAAAAELPWVKAGQARVRITGSVALSDEEFATVAEGAVAGIIGSAAAGDAVAGAGGAVLAADRADPG